MNAETREEQRRNSADLGQDPASSSRDDKAIPLSSSAETHGFQVALVERVCACQVTSVGVHRFAPI